MPNRRTPQSIAFIVALVFPVALSIGCSRTAEMTVGGNYPAVTPDQLAGRASSQRTGPDRFEFNWSFGASTFTVEGTQIPPDIVTELLGPGESSTWIQGTWEIRDGRVHFGVDTGVGDKTRECSLPIYSTGPIRIETSEAQYVF